MASVKLIGAQSDLAILLCNEPHLLNFMCVIIYFIYK